MFVIVALLLISSLLAPEVLWSTKAVHAPVVPYLLFRQQGKCTRMFSNRLNSCMRSQSSRNAYLAVMGAVNQYWRVYQALEYFPMTEPIVVRCLFMLAVHLPARSPRDMYICNCLALARYHSTRSTSIMPATPRGSKLDPTLLYSCSRSRSHPQIDSFRKMDCLSDT